MAELCNKPFRVLSVWLTLCWIGCVDCVEEAHSVVNAHGICGTFVWNRGYDYTEFIVPTKDGVLLAVQKMSNRTSGTSRKEPIFLHHGLIEGGQSWLLNEPNVSLAFMLAHSGYDVWIANGRTKTFSYGHITYNRAQKVLHTAP
ncbi:hypothetical protein SUGI_0106590 [Cryptomeria japonica]|nr:hypothetical protein SUGI_0106590 [Cryptomeria japonica]